MGKKAFFFSPAVKCDDNISSTFLSRGVEVKLKYSPRNLRNRHVDEEGRTTDVVRKLSLVVSGEGRHWRSKCGARAHLWTV